MEPITIRIPLRYGLVADLVSDPETERSPYQPPVIPWVDHHPQCQCGNCVSLRGTRR